MIKSEMVPRKDAIGVISRLKSEGYMLGLISNCTHEGTIVWEDTPFPSFFDTVVFSCVVGMKKPDPRIYKLAMDKLGTRSRECLYIGDGGCQELSGAFRVGIYAVLIDILDKSSNDMYRGLTGAEKWEGPVITCLKEVLTLVK
jgi:putative hydrolase of the HAD superfamily